MVDWSRRKLLAGIGTSVTLATAGCASSDDEKPEEDEETDEKKENGDEKESEETPDDDSSEEEQQPEGAFDSLLTYLPLTEKTDVPNIYASDVTEMNKVNEPFDSFASEFSLSYLEPHTDDVSKAVGLNADGGSTGEPISVFRGEISPEAESETRQTDAGEEYEYYELSGRVAAVYDGVSFVANSDQVIESALAANREDESRFLDEKDVTAVITERYPDSDLVLASGLSENSAGLFPNLKPEDMSHFAYAVTVHGPDRLETSFEIKLADADLVTDERVKQVEDLGRNVGPSTGEGTASVEGGRITVRETVDLEKVRKAEEIESPQLDGVHDPDLDAETIEIKIREGDETPVDELELRVNEETYDPDVWAGGKETISAGDAIQIKTEDVSPNTQVTLVHSHEYGSESSTTTILSWLEFRLSYDRDNRAATLTYTDDIELNGDELYVAVYEGSEYGVGDEKIRSTQPWTGETVTNGDEVTVEDVDPGQALLVGWGGDTQTDSLTTKTVSPPGSASFEHDHAEDTLSVTLQLEESWDASKFELRVNEEPADTQWTDQGDTVEDGATITVDDLSVRDEVAVLWAPTGARVGGYWVSPPGEATFEYDHSSEELTITMKLGEPQDAGNYVIKHNDEETDTQWTDQGDTVEDGDSLTLSDVTIGDRVRVEWTDEEMPVGFYHVSPPGEATFTYTPENGRLTVELELDSPQPAAKYTLKINDEPASTQWSDKGDTVEDGDTLAIENVERGAEIEVVWGEEEAHIAGTEAYPTADLSFDLDQESGLLTIAHDGGASFTPDNLTLIVAGGSGEPDRYPLGNHLDGEFTDGDTVEIETGSLAESRFVGVLLGDEEHLVAEYVVGRDEEGEGDDSGSDGDDSGSEDGGTDD